MYSVRTMLQQSALLAEDIEKLIGPLAIRAGEALEAVCCDDLRRVVLVGSGDSHHAGRAAELAFERLADISCQALSTQQFLDYGMLAPARESRATLVVAVSASGSSPRLLTAVRHARTHGFPTVAVTGRSDSAIVSVAGRHVAAELGLTERCPGIRTYQASLLALLLLAVRLSALRRALPGQPVAAEESLVAEIAATADAVRASHADADEPCRELAARLSEGGWPWIPLVIAGTGPGRGTAMYTAAKVVEAAGLPAYAQDVEEYWHIERFLDPADAPLVVVAPSGLGHPRAVELARAAAGRGRRVVAVTGQDETTLTRAAWHTVPVAPTAREEWSPLAGHVFAGLLGARLAERLGRTPFSGGGPP
ncbi:SIS domain-containing protein [Streptomyces sp. SLBN-115]|uniref:SIS domain-containing protein n=1 Tax=Streptomyces sp. SLBN-115 TaxID=2768453 RepID=UPI00114F50D3|nr:SIS domain-containing protein [Streptomyces sp. SLBN-115]TQJ37050.1 glucosamine--fructose-6-phosphate aminotransferase (isomerizing) [Streptomyces sp. SLBN-115]